MAKSEDKRLDDLEKKTGGDDEIKINVNWGPPGMVLDDETGKYITPDAWRRKHPGDRLIIVDAWDNDDQDK